MEEPSSISFEPFDCLAWANLRVNALKFPVAKGLHFDKQVTLNGINNFDGNVKLKEFQVTRFFTDQSCRLMRLT